MRKLAISAVRSLCLFGFVCVGVAGCGDDAGDGKDDAGTKKDGGLGSIPRMDSGVGDELVPVCDRTDPKACDTGKVCNEVLRQQSNGDVVLYTGCVTASSLRAPGDVCTPFQDQYMLDGLTDTVLLDPCGQGSYCIDDPAVRGASKCQLSCSSGFFGDAPSLCKDGSQYCFGPGELEETCRNSDGCDPIKQTGCASGKGCYMQVNDQGTGMLSVCLTPGDPQVADHAACQYVNDCKPGSSCLGPVGKTLDMWTPDDFVCRPTCGASDEEDAGAGDGGASCSCAPYSSSSLDFSEIPSMPYGQCDL